MTDKSMPPVDSSTPAAAPMPKPTGGFYLINNLMETIFIAVFLSIFFIFTSVAVVVLIHISLAIHIAIYLCLAGHAFFRCCCNLHPMYHPYGADVTVTGLSLEELLSLPCFVHPGSEAECAVCLEGLRAGDLCRALPVCNHEFHSKCVDRWLVTRPACPVCRRGVAVDGELMQAKAGWL